MSYRDEAIEAVREVVVDAMGHMSLRFDIGDLAEDLVDAVYDESKMPKFLEGKACRYCGTPIIFGHTHKDQSAPFNARPPFANHWSTCTKAGEARKDYPR